MPSVPFEVVWPQIECAEFVQILRAQPRKFIEQLPQRLALNLPRVSRTIKRFKRSSLAKLQDHLYAGNPVRAFGVIQMAYYLEGAPGSFPFVAQCPSFRQMPQQCTKRPGHAAQKRYRILQFVSPQKKFRFTMR